MSILKELSSYSATEQEITSIAKHIAQNGLWEKQEEWRISTVMDFKIEPQMKDGRNWFITTVKCEQEIMIPAATIERAIIFMKAYRDFLIDLFYHQGWASQSDNKMSNPK